MDTRLLRTFSAVVTAGSFTGAAQSLGYTQSAVSQQVAALESSLGTTLFRRRPFAITPAGSRLAEHAANILLRLDVAASEVASIDPKAITTVVATPLAASSHRVATLLALRQRADRSSTAVLATAPVDDIVASVARRQCSAGVVDGIVGRSDPLGLADPGLLTSLLLSVDELAVVVPADHPFAARRAVSWRSVADAQWVDAPQLTPRSGPGAAQLLERRRAHVRYDGGDPAVLGTLVAAGHGLALVPASWSAGASSARIVPLTDPPLVHRIEVLVLRQHADTWEQLVALVRSS